MTDSRTRIPSPARSVGALMTPRRHKNPRKTRSVCSPARSNASGRLSALIQEHKDSNVGSFKMSPLVRRSVLPDNTEIDEPGNASWWRNLNDESRDVMEVLKDNAIQPHNIMEELNIEVLSQEEKRYTLDIPDSSDSESINSIIIPQRKFFHEKENHPQKQFEQFGTRETLDKLHKSNAAAANKTVTAGTKELFQAQPRTKPVFPAALLDISTNTSASEKTLVAALRPKAGIRNLLGNVQATKRKNMFAKFIESDTEDEISDIPEAPKILFDVQKLGPVRRPSARSSSSKLRDHSPTSNVTSDSFADWDHLPSSTMVDNQLEAVMTGGQKAKRSKLSKLSEADSTSTKSDKTKQSDKSALTVDPKFQTITIEKSLQQNTYIVTKNHSTVTQETEGQLNDSQEAQNKSHLSPRNISQTSMTTRSKNKSVLSKVPKVSLNKSRNASIKTKNTSNTPKKIDNTVNKSITKKDSVTKNVSVTDADENELNEPDQNNDDELHFSLEYESDDNADEVNVAEKSKYISSKNESVTNNAKQKKDISNASNNLQNTVNKVVEESGEISDNHHKSRLSSQNDEQNENEKNVYNHMDVDETENMSPNKIVEKEVINKNKATDKEPQNVQRKSIEKRNISANVSQIKGSVVDKKGAEIQNKTQNEGIEIQNTSVNTNEKNMESQNEILNEKSLITQDKDHHKSDIEGDNNDINEQSQNIVPERDEKNEEEQDESKSNKEENAEFENDQNYTIEKQSEIEHDGDELNKSEEQRDETEKENESQEEQIKSQDSSQNEIEEDSNEEQDEKENDAEKNECDEEIEAEEQYSTQKELNESRDDNPANTQSESEDSNRDMEDEDRNISNEDANESVEEATAESDQEVESDQEQENNESHQEVESDQEQENNESHQEVESDQEQENNESHQEVETDQEQENNESHGEVESGQEHENSESHQEVESDQEQENNESHQEVETDQEQENNESHREVESDQEHENSESHREVESGKEQENNDSNQELESDQDVNDQSDDNNQIDNTKTPNVSHDTTGRNRIKNPKRTLEVGLFNKSRDQDQTFVGSAQNTSIRKTKSIVHPNIAQVKSISLVASGENSKESLRLSGPGNSSAEGSGWDSHRTTRKTLRQTFGKDFTPRKSLRAMVMEKSAKRHTLAKDTDTTSAVPIANSTEFGDPSMDHGDYEMNDEPEESVHEVSLRTRKAKLEEYLQKIRKDITEENAKIVASVTRQLEQKPKNPVNPFQVPARPMFPRRGISKPKPKTKKPILHPVPLESLPKEFLQDIKYKPPKRFCPRNAPWLTKHFYKYVETKLEPKYDYKARVRAEKFAQTLHGFVQDNRRRDEVSADAVEALKREMARLNIVQTHSDFYNFFWDFMPKEVQLKVIPMVSNRMPIPRDIYSNILESSAHS